MVHNLVCTRWQWNWIFIKQYYQEWTIIKQLSTLKGQKHYLETEWKQPTIKPYENVQRLFSKTYNRHTWSGMLASSYDSISSWEWQYSLTKRKAVSCFYDYLMCFGNYPLGSAPHRYDGLSWSNAAAAETEVGTCFQALRSELETHKAKLFLTARTDDVLAACFVMLQFLTAGGTGPDGGACCDIFNLSELDSFAALE